MKPAKKGRVRIHDYDSPTGGWGSAQSLLRNAAGQGLALSDIWATLLRQNKADGFMCVSCSWAKPADPHVFEFCENGAKATFWEQTKRRCDREFFERHTVSELLQWPDYDLEAQGRLTEPMRYNPQTDRYEPVAFEIPAGNCAGYYPELNPLVPLWHHEKKAHVPAAKSVPVRIARR